MIKQHDHHAGYYLILFLVMTLASIFAYYSRENKQLEMMILVLMASVYILFGVIHHYIIHDLSAKIVIEYIGIGSLGLAISLFVIKGFML